MTQLPVPMLRRWSRQTGRIEPDASTLRRPLQAGFLIGSAIVITFVGLVSSILFAVGCSENLHPETDRQRVCNSVDETGDLLVLLFVPLLALLASQAVPWFRRHAWLPALAILAITIAGWTYLLLIASSTIGETSID